MAGTAEPDQARSVMSAAADAATLAQAENVLRVSEDRYRRILETMHEGCCLLTADSIISFVNARLCSMLGYQPRELQGRRSVEVFGTSSSGLLSGGRRTHSARQHDVALRHKDGSTVWALVSGTPMLDDDGQPTAMLAMFSDVTARRQSEERVLAAAAQIEQLTADAIYTVDAERRVWSWNRGAEQLFGWTKEEVIGEPVALVPPQRIERARVAIQRLISTGETLIQEAVRFAKDGHTVHVLGSWSPVPLADGRTGVLCILKDMSEHKRAHDELQEQARSLALLRERERIAMDLHDGVTQSLYGVTLSLGALRRRHGDVANQDAVLGSAISQLTEIIQGIRNYIFELRTGVPEGTDLESGLNAKAQELASATGVMPRLAVEANLGRLSGDSVTHLLYIVHEALSNVARHAKASEVAIEALPWGSGIMLSITDNGRGFDSGRRGRRAGDGLRNMHERAAQLGAKLSVDSQPGVGTTVRVQVP
jgi:two-component system, NarL family, sensor histidine kinase DevS